MAAPYRLNPDEARALALQRHPPTFAARAAVIYDMTSDRLLLAQNAHTPLAPASLTKMMTALLVREHLNLEDVVVIPPEAARVPSPMRLRPGQQVTVRALLYGMMLPSDNAAAISLAHAAAGDVETFVQWMNEKAAQMALEHTHFVNPHGLDATGHVSTAWDLARIAAALLADPVLARIVATSEADVEGWHLINRNRLLSTRQDVIGVKTGTTLLAGECLVAAFREDGHIVITVVLGARDRYAVTEALWAYYRQTYAWVRLRLPPGAMNRILGPWGRRAFKEVAEPRVLLPRWAVKEVNIYRAIRKPRRTDHGWNWPTSAGRVIFRLGPHPLMDVDLMWKGEPNRRGSR